MANDLRIKTRKFPLPFNGPDSSADLKAFSDNVFFDLSSLSDKVYDLQKQLDYVNQVRMKEMVLTIEAQSFFARSTNVLNDFKSQASQPINSEIDYCIDFSADNTISFQGAFEKHALLSKNKGEVRPPRNNVISFFYQRDSINGIKAISRNPVVAITSEPSDPDLKIESNDTSNMANGANEFYWYRKYSYPAYHDISSVTVDFTIDVPIIAGIETNFLCVDPFPVGDLTIHPIGSDGGAVTSSDIESASPFSVETPQGITQLTFSFTQENFTIENGRKVFMIGAKEIDAQFVEWDTTVTSPAKDPVADNHIEVWVTMEELVTSISDLMVKGDFSHLTITGYLTGTPDANVISVTRTSFNDGNNNAIAHAFAGSVDSIKATLFLNADPAEDGDRISGKIDHAEIICFRAE